MEPIVTHNGKVTQLSYELPRRVFVSKVYPVKSSNGSTIIIYGHASGLSIMWRGGRPLRTPRSTQAKRQHKQPNGTSNDAIMLIDSDDDEPTHQTNGHTEEEEADFESEEEEEDPSAPYPPIIQQLDISLDTEVLHIAIPRIPTANNLRSPDTVPHIFSQQIVFSVACGDCKIRVITLPLTPPSNARKSEKNQGRREARWNEDILDLGGLGGCQNAATSISMTWTSRNPVAFKEPAEDAVLIESPRRKKVGSRAGKPNPTEHSEAQDWDLLIAAHYPEMTGLLYLFRVPLASDRIHRALLRGPPLPEQTQYLRSPATTIAFSPALHPNRRHSQLLVLEPKGIVRIYDPLGTPRKRPASAISDSDSSSGLADNGLWLAAFHTSFETPKDPETASPFTVQRKRILDAQWATDGRCIIALLADGEWGIWDIEQTGPSSAVRSASRPTDPLSFVLRGYVSSTHAGSAAGANKHSMKNSVSLAPMTPNTRRTKQKTSSLFVGQGNSSGGLGSPHNSRGGINIASLASESGGVSEDSVILWYDTDAYRIANLAQFWSRNSAAAAGSSSTSSASSSLYGGGLTRVDGFTTHGEMINHIDQFAITTQESRAGLQRDLLITAEHRLCFVSAKGARERERVRLFEQERDGDQAVEERTRKVDQQLLERGELDLGGMERLLTGLGGAMGVPAEAPSVSAAAPRSLFGRKVGFAG